MARRSIRISLVAATTTRPPTTPPSTAPPTTTPPKISFGGASGIELVQACSTVDSLLAEYQAVVSAYSLKYVDFDIEGAASADPASFNRRSRAIARQPHEFSKIFAGYSG